MIFNRGKFHRVQCLIEFGMRLSKYVLQKHTINKYIHRLIIFFAQLTTQVNLLIMCLEKRGY